MRFRRYLFLSAVLFGAGPISGTALALTGNGGDAMRKPDGRILNYDLLEASIKTISFSQVNEADATLKARVRSRLAPLNVSETVLEGISHKFNEMEKTDVVFAWKVLRVLEQLDWLLVDPVTINVPDENTKVSKDNADSMVHVAERVETTVRVDEELWPLMDDTHKQGAIWHELILAIKRPGENNAPQDSGPVRKIVGKFLGAPINWATANLFEEEINGSYWLCPKDLKEVKATHFCHASKSITSVTELERTFKMYSDQMFFGTPVLHGVDFETLAFYVDPTSNKLELFHLYPAASIFDRTDKHPELLFEQPVAKADITDAWYKQVEQETILPICRRVLAAFDEVAAKYPHLKLNAIHFDREPLPYDAIGFISVESMKYSSDRGKIKEYFTARSFDFDDKFKKESQKGWDTKIARAEPYFMDQCSDYFRASIFMFKEFIGDYSELND